MIESAWEKDKNPNFFGGWPLLNTNGKIVSIKIAAFGHLAKVLAEEDIQRRLEEAIRKIIVIILALMMTS